MVIPKYKYDEVIKYWKEIKKESKEDYLNILESFSVLFAYNSGVIENDKITYHDTREIFENGKVINFTGDLKTLYEINNQKDCYEYLLDKIVKNTPISEQCIKKIHQILTKGTYDERRYVVNGERPGEYKKHDYVTGINEVGSLVEDVQSDIQSLIEEMNSINVETDIDIIKTAAYVHNVIEQIHPFADGNGRVGRILANYTLMINDLPPIIIYEENKKFYYEALEKFDVDEELEPMVEFFKYEMEKTWEKTLDKYKSKKERI
jgi:Fic family protein